MITNIILLFCLTIIFPLSPTCNVGDSLWHIEAKIGNLLDSNAALIQDFTNTTTALTQVLLETCTLESRIDLLSTELLGILSTTTNNLSTIIELELSVTQSFNNSFSLLQTIFQQACDIDSKIDILADEVIITTTQIPALFNKLCTIESSLDLLVGVGENEFNDIAATITLLSPVNEKTSIIVHNITTLSEWSATPVTGSPSVIINEPGCYCLTGSMMATIIINSDDVTLDLNGYTISIPPGQSGIEIQNVFGKAIAIKNGSINGQNNGSVGININKSSHINIANIFIYSCLTGIQINESQGCIINDSALFNSDVGILLLSSQNNSIEDVSIISGKSVGIQCSMNTNNTNNQFIRCKITHLLNTGDSRGIHLADGQLNLCLDCIIDTIMSTDASPGTIIAGIVLDGTETLSKILHCTVSNVRCSNSGPTPYGIITTENTQVNQINGNVVLGVTCDGNGIGFERIMTNSTQPSLFVNNIGFNNDTNFGLGFDITDFFEGGLNGTAGTLENISLPPL